MIRLAHIDDLEQIWSLRLKTTELLKSRHIDQWQYHKPERSTFIEDILAQEFYVYEKAHKIIGMIAIRSGIEQTYINIFDGKWRKDEAYYTIHRLAVDHNHLGKGIAKKMITFAHDLAKINGINYMRIDTHEDNHYAQNLFMSIGYIYTGYILLEENHPGQRKRLAYDIILSR